MIINREIPGSASYSQEFGVGMDLMDHPDRAGSAPSSPEDYSQKKPGRTREWEKKAAKIWDFCGFLWNFVDGAASEARRSIPTEQIRKSINPSSFPPGIPAPAPLDFTWAFPEKSRSRWSISLWKENGPRTFPDGFSPRFRIKSKFLEPGKSHGHAGIPMELS